MAGFPKAGDEFGRYRVEHLLGRGGMGVVYQCTDTLIGRSVALKVLNPMFSDQVEFRERFAHEAGVLGRLDSPHIVQVFDYGEIDDCLFIATQLIPDGDLRRHYGETGFTDPRQAIEVVAQVCEALADAHENGVIHRDIKPSNVLIRRRPKGLKAYLCDFGIAWIEGAEHTRTGLLVGSTAYMAPERHNGARADERSDIYSVGCLLWSALTGTPLHPGTDTQVAIAHLYNPAPLLTPPESPNNELNTILQRALAKDPAERFQTAEELGDALGALDLADPPEPPAANEISEVQSRATDSPPPDPVSPDVDGTVMKPHDANSDAHTFVPAPATPMDLPEAPVVAQQEAATVTRRVLAASGAFVLFVALTLAMAVPSVRTPILELFRNDTTGDTGDNLAATPTYSVRHDEAKQPCEFSGCRLVSLKLDGWEPSSNVTCSTGGFRTPDWAAKIGTDRQGSSGWVRASLNGRLFDSKGERFKNGTNTGEFTCRQK